MTEAHEIVTPVSGELADAVREVNAGHALIGSPRIDRLDRLWVGLRPTLEETKATGDTPAAKREVRLWRERPLNAIEEVSQ